MFHRSLMSSSSDMGPAATAGPAESASGGHPVGWREALMGLIASRVALIQLESKDVARDGAKRALLLLAVVGCVFFGWILLLAGAVALLASATGWPWSWVAIGLALTHLLLALILAKIAKPSQKPAFPYTRAEFQKDREWIENFQKTSKSNN